MSSHRSPREMCEAELSVAYSRALEDVARYEKEIQRRVTEYNDKVRQEMGLHLFYAHDHQVYIGDVHEIHAERYPECPFKVSATTQN